MKSAQKSQITFPSALFVPHIHDSSAPAVCISALPNTADDTIVERTFPTLAMAFVSPSLPLRSRYRPRTPVSPRPGMTPLTPRMSSGSSELRRRLASVNSAEKLIDAMRLVAAARIRASSAAALQTRPFAEKLQTMLASLLASMARDGHDALHAASGRARFDAYAVLADDRVSIDPLAQRALMDRLHLVCAAPARPVRTVCIVVVAADKGFCGTFNRNVITRAATRARYLRDDGIHVELVCLGRVASAFFKRNSDIPIRHSVELSGPAASPDPSSELCDVLLTSFIAGEVDRIEVVYTRFVSILSNTPSVRTLVPVTPSGIESLGDEIFELTSANGVLSTRPYAHDNDKDVVDTDINNRLHIEAEEAAVLLNAMLPMYVNSQLVRVLRESTASEHASRMNAMSIATDNARSIADALKLKYNKERQARITTEIVEVTANAPASF